ncbi:MAG: AAA family ATPase [Verrucomicrobia bacterium]|nr:AAA family ATPase [Verrucomicrobiota bacterium]
MYVKSLQFENLKSFKKLRFDFTRPDGSLPGWNVFVGGNASGKSTILKAIALVLAGPTAARQLISSMAGWITAGETLGRAKLEIQWDHGCDRFRPGGAPPVSGFEAGLRWQRENPDGQPVLKEWEFRNPQGTRIQSANRGPWNPNAGAWFLCGYGPLRRLTGSSNEATRHALAGGKEASLVTLFYEDAALSESEVWLKELQFKELERDPKAKVLLAQIKAFLNDGLLPRGFELERITSDHVYVRSGKSLELPMRDLSDGCRSAYAVILDIIHHMAEAYGVEALFERNHEGHWVVPKPGVILIDEVESHLHPAWQSQICEWLKERFPKVQFFVTSHSPLIVQAADPNGIFVLPLPGENRKARQLDVGECERIRLGKAEKVLLGEAFGLQSTRSQWALQRIRHWQELNAKKQAGVSFTTPEAKEYQNLELQMELAFEDNPELLHP